MRPGFPAVGRRPPEHSSAGRCHGGLLACPDAPVCPVLSVRCRTGQHPLGIHFHAAGRPDLPTGPRPRGAVHGPHPDAHRYGRAEIAAAAPAPHPHRDAQPVDDLERVRCLDPAAHGTLYDALPHPVRPELAGQPGRARIPARGADQQAARCTAPDAQMDVRRTAHRSLLRLCTVLVPRRRRRGHRNGFDRCRPRTHGRFFATLPGTTARRTAVYL